MANLNQSKKYGTAIYPVHALATSGLMRRCEPILNPEQLVSRFLKGIPLKLPNGDQFTVDELKDRIYLATNTAETLLGTVITREQFQEKSPFDYALYRAFVHIMSEHRPIISIEHLAIVASDQHTIFELPPEWIESSGFAKGLINVIPLLAAFGGAQASGGSPVGAGIAFLSILSQMTWVPAYWQISYTAGLSNKEGGIPTPVNELIGCIAAIDILSEIAPLYYLTSQSQSQDGISQSSSGPGPRRFILRIEELMAKRDELVRKLKAIFQTRLFVGNI